MKRVKIDNLQLGDVLAKELYDGKGNLIGAEGFEINERTKEYLKRLEITEVFIKDDYNNGDVVITEIIPSELKKETMLSMMKKDTSDTIINAKKIVEEVMQKDEILFDEIPIVRNPNYGIYQKAVQVCLYSLAVAKRLGINDQNRLNELAIAALFHKLGDTLLSKENKGDDALNDALKQHLKITGSLDMYEQYMSHIYLANWLRSNPEINAKIINTIMTYRENINGTGFPFKYTEEKIPLEARIIRVCTDYDTLVNEKNGHQLISLTQMKTYEGKLYDAVVLNEFIRTLTFYPKGIEVKLSDGRVGLIYQNHAGQPDRPTIIFKDGSLLDLSKAAEPGYEYLRTITISGTHDSSLEKQANFRR